MAAKVGAVPLFIFGALTAIVRLLLSHPLDPVLQQLILAWLQVTEDVLNRLVDADSALEDSEGNKISFRGAWPCCRR